MEHNASQNGKMTQDRADAIRNFVRQSESAVSKEIQGLKNNTRSGVDEDEAHTLGVELIKEVTNSNWPDLNKIKELIKRGADPNTRDEQGTVLMRASENGYTDLVKTLLSVGADVNAIDSLNWTALMLASFHNKGEIVTLLLRNGAVVDSKTNDGRTALMFASEYGNEKIIKTLLNNGADVSIKDVMGKTAADRAHSAVKRLLEHASRAK